MGGVGGGKEGVGVAATVWDGEVVGVRGVLKLAPADRRPKSPSPIRLPSGDSSRTKGRTDW